MGSDYFHLTSIKIYRKEHENSKRKQWSMDHSTVGRNTKKCDNKKEMG
jgi:hypothetical protein